MKIHRIAVSGLFAINGFVHANWASRLPEFQELLSINNTQLGSLLFTMALGALFAMPFTGWLAFRYGSATITRMLGILLCLTVSVLSISQNLILEGFIFFILGIANGAMDVTMNEQAVFVEREYKKPIMSSFHAFWSIGMAIGAGSGAIFSKLSVPLHWHLLTIGVIGLVVVLWTTANLIVVPHQSDKKPSLGLVLPTRSIVPLGAIAFCAMLNEGTIIDWSAIFMTRVVGETEAMGAIAFGSFGASMMIGRMTGDYLTRTLGKKNLLLLDSILALVGLGVTILFVSPEATLVGFFIAGLGLSTIVPIIYTTAGNAHEISPSLGIAMATTIGYAGFFVGPPTIGFLADTYSLRFGLGFSWILLVIMLALILIRPFGRGVANSGS